VSIYGFGLSTASVRVTDFGGAVVLITNFGFACKSAIGFVHAPRFR